MKEGYNSNRLSSNPREKVFLEVFNNEFMGCTRDGLLATLKQNGLDIPFATISDEEERIALSIIQWLGSPVGQAFLDRVQETEGEL